MGLVISPIMTYMYNTYSISRKVKLIEIIVEPVYHSGHHDVMWWLLSSSKINHARVWENGVNGWLQPWLAKAKPSQMGQFNKLDRHSCQCHLHLYPTSSVYTIQIFNIFISVINKQRHDCYLQVKSKPQEKCMLCIYCILGLEVHRGKQPEWNT